MMSEELNTLMKGEKTLHPENYPPEVGLILAQNVYISMTMLTSQQAVPVSDL